MATDMTKIILHINNGTDYDGLYPQTTTNNVEYDSSSTTESMISDVFQLLGSKAHSVTWNSSTKTLSGYTMTGAKSFNFTF